MSGSNSLHLSNPEKVYHALRKNRKVSKWLSFISNHYEPPRKKVLLIYPCASVKPFTRSRSYRQLFKTLSALSEKRNDVHLVTISEPFGLIPEEFYGKTEELYDCPGLFRWFCLQHYERFDVEYLEKSIEILAEHVAHFFTKASDRRRYSKIIAFVRTYSSGLRKRDDHTHRRIVELAARKSKVKVKILPKKRMVQNIVMKRGRYAWDRYGVGHPLAQEYLFKYLQDAIDRHD